MCALCNIVILSRDKIHSEQYTHSSLSLMMMRSLPVRSRVSLISDRNSEISSSWNLKMEPTISYVTVNNIIFILSDSEWVWVVLGHIQKGGTFFGSLQYSQNFRPEDHWRDLILSKCASWSIFTKGPWHECERKSKCCIHLPVGWNSPIMQIRHE
jgi:hypothetical protein